MKQQLPREIQPREKRLSPRRVLLQSRMTSMPRTKRAVPRFLTGGWPAGIVCVAMILGLGAPAWSETDSLATDEGVADPEARRAEATYRFAVGKVLAEEASYAEARESLLTALELDSSDPYIHLAIAELYNVLADGARSRDDRFQHLQEAASYAVSALDRAPENPDVLRVYGRVHFSLAENQASALRKAREAYESLREQEKEDLQILVSLGQIHLWNREFADAADVLREAASQRPGNPMIGNMLLDALLGSEAFADAAPLLAEQLAANPASVEYREQLAEVYQRIGNSSQAAEVLAAAPESVRRDPRYKRRLAVGLHGAGRDEEALAIVDALLADDAEDEEIHRLRVAVLSALTRYEEALETLARWQPTEPDQARQRVLVQARLLERLGRTEESYAMLADHHQNDDDLQVVLGVAGVLERSGRYDDAADVLSKRMIGAEAGDLVVVTRAIADVYIRGGQSDKAIAVYERSIDELEKAENLPAARHLAVRRLAALAEGERWTDAIDAAQPLLEVDEADTTFAARVTLATAQAQTGKLDDALETLNKAAEIVPRAARQLTARRVGLLFEFDRRDAAAAEIDTIAALGGADDLLFAGQLWQQAEEWDASLPFLQKAEAMASDPSSALFAQAVAHERSGDIARSAEIFERLLVATPDDARTLNYLGYMWADRGENLERALDMIRRAVALDPDNGAYMDSLGWAYFQVGDYEAARRYLEWAARLIRDDATVHEHLGDVYVALRQPDQARESYRQALALGADDPNQVRGKLERLDESFGQRANRSNNPQDS